MSGYMGYSGYYHVGILYGVDNTEICQFGYRVMGNRRRSEQQALQGVGTGVQGYTIEVMGEDNPFEQRYKVKLDNGKMYRVESTTDQLYNNYGDDTQIITVELLRS